MFPLAFSFAPSGVVTVDDKLILSVPAAAGESVHVSILRDCDGDGTPDPRWTKGGCLSPVFTRQVQLDNKGNAVGPFTLGESEAVKAMAAPFQLGLTVTRAAGEVGEVERVRVGGAACDVYSPWITSFLASCREDFASVLYGTREVASTLQGQFVVYLAKAEDAAPAVTMLGTMGVNGVDWEDAEHLLVTRGQGQQRAAGLYRVDLEGEGAVLVEAAPDHDFAAPLFLGKDGYAYVDRTSAGDTLVVHQKGKVKASVPMARRVESLLGYDGASIVAFTASPTYGLVRVHLKSGLVEDLGWNASVYTSLAVGATGRSIAAYRDDAAGQGWELAVTDATGKVIANLRVGGEPGVDDLRPAWRPGKNEVAWVGEVR